MSAEHLALYDSDFRAENRKVVFGKGREKNSNPELRFGLTPNPHGTSALIGFRRTDADRKPARVVIRSNDGPGDMAERYRLAEERKEAIERKAIRLARNGMTYEQHKAKIEQFNRRLVIQALVQHGAMTMMEIAEKIGMDTGAVSILCARMADAGLLTKQRYGNAKSNVYSTPTEAGLALLAGAEA